MAINLKEIGNDPIYGREIIAPPLNYNFTLIQDIVNQHILDISNATNQLSGKADSSDVYSIGSIDSEDINNDTLFSGYSNIKEVLDYIYNNALMNATTDDVANVSGVIGSNTTIALDTLKSLIDNIETGDSNAQIGVYPLSDLVNTNNYVSDYGNLTLFAGLMATLEITNINTGSSTLDITDGNGAKNIKYYDNNGNKQLLSGGELYGTIIVYYDGVDWIDLSYNYGVGNLSELTTNNKTNIVDAINEIDEKVDDIGTNKDTANSGELLVSNGDGTSSFTTVSGNDSDARLELLDIKMQLEIDDIIEFIGDERVGFYDVFDTTNYVDTVDTNATVNTTAQDVTFLNENETYDITSNGAFTATTEINTLESAIIGDKIDNTNEILDVVEVDDSVTYDVTTPVQLEQYYSTEGNGGRKIVRLDNGTLVSALIDNSNIYLYKSINNGITWSMCYSNSGSSMSDISIVGDGKYIHIVNTASDSNIQYHRFNSETDVTDINVNIEASQTAMGKCSLAINQDNTKITATWSSKNSTYPNSFNIRAIQGTISEGVVTWGSVEQITIFNTTNNNWVTPTVIYNNENYPLLIYINNDTASNPDNQVVRGVKFNGSTWVVFSFYNGSTYTQSNPSATFMPPEIATKIDSSYTDGLIIVTWEGYDSVETLAQNIRCKASSDNGATWFDFGITNEKVTSGNNFRQFTPSVTWNNDGDIFIVWYGSDGSNKIREIERNVALGYGSINNVTNNVSLYPNSCDNYHDFDKPLTIYQDSTDSDVKFYGKWTVGSTSYDLTLNSPITTTDQEVLTVYDSSYPYQQLQMKPQEFDIQASEVDIILYSKTENTVKVNADVVDDNVINISDELNVGDKLWTGEVNEITDVTEVGSDVTYDKTGIEQTVDIAGGTSFNNGDKIVSDSEGNLYEVYKGTDNQIYCRKWTRANDIWSDMSFPILTSYYQEYPSIAIDSKNNLHVVWDGADVNNSAVQVKYSKFNGTSWSSWVNIEVTGNYQQSLPSIAIDNEDNLHVVWEGRDSVNTTYIQIKYSKFTTSWSSWVNIQEISGYNQSKPAIAIDSNDNLHVVWHGKDSVNTANNQIKYSNFNGTSWSNWINIQSLESLTQQNPSIIIDLNDNLHVVWDGTDSGNTSYGQIKYSKFTTYWSDWVNISIVSGYAQYVPSIAIDSNDNLHVVWQGNDNTSIDYRQIKYSKFTTSWSAWVGITTGKTASQQFPSICKTIKTFEEPVVIWQDTELNQVSIYGKWTVGSKSYDTTLTHNVTVSEDDLIPKLDYKAYINGSEANLEDYDSANKQYGFNIENVNSDSVSVKIKGKDITLDNVLFAIS